MASIERLPGEPFAVFKLRRKVISRMEKIKRRPRVFWPAGEGPYVKKDKENADH